MQAKRNGTQRQTALVTGGSSGIGLELAKNLAPAGFDLVLVGRKRDTLEAAAGQLEGKFGIKAHVFAADLRLQDAPQAIFDFLSNENIDIDVLVNNAGFGLGGEFADTAIQRELDMIQVNIAALTHLTKLFISPMIKRKSGRVLNVASTAAFQPGPLMAVYYATKAYVLSFSEALAEELRHTGVTVTALCPGPTETGFAAEAGVESVRLFTLMKPSSSAAVARTGYKAMKRGRRVAVHGLINKSLTQSLRVTPRRLGSLIVRKLQENRTRSEERRV